MVTLAESSGPTGDPVHGIIGVSSSSACSSSLTFAELVPDLLEVQVLLVVLGLQLGPGLLVGLGELPGEGLAPGLRLVELTLEFAAGLVQAEQFVHVQVDALDPDGRLYGFRVIPDESSVQHGGNATRRGAPRAEDDWTPVRWRTCWSTNHVLSGAVIGAATRRRPVPAFAPRRRCLISRSTRCRTGASGRGTPSFMQVAVPDGLAGLAVMGAMTAVAPRGARRRCSRAWRARRCLTSTSRPSSSGARRGPSR